MVIDLIFLSSLLAVFFSLMVFSYVFGNNPVFRFAMHILIGTAAGYAGAIALLEVVIPFFKNLVQAGIQGNVGQIIYFVFSILLVLMLITKTSSKLSNLGTPVVAFIMGVGVAIAITGAINGTIIPLATGIGKGYSSVFGLAAISFTVVGAVSTLVYFSFSARVQGEKAEAPKLAQMIGRLGKLFIAAALGTVFGSVLLSGFTALLERVNFFLQFFGSIF
ncbi:MAG: hypothetical protein JXA19_06725 [Anaerolineales bacterium]|nr:hypothetical protein [Anaerolineales bacterium]